MRRITGITIVAIWMSLNAIAQAVPDSSLNSPVPDTLAARKQFESSGPGLTVIAGRDHTSGKDSAITHRFTPNPKKSGLYSAIVPGAGQLYNRQYWKIPVVYAGMAVSGYFLITNARDYNTYRTALIRRTDGDPRTRDDYETLYTEQNLRDLRDGFKRYLDMTVLLTTLGYAIQVLDAVTYAHLHDFDVTPDISLRLSPVLAPGYAGLGLVVKWR